MNIKPLPTDQNVALSVCELSAFCHLFLLRTEIKSLCLFKAPQREQQIDGVGI
jgi:hypothetical protein